MFSKFNEESQKVLLLAKKEMMDLKHSYIGTEHLLLAILKTKNNISTKLIESNVNYKSFKTEIVKALGVGKEIVSVFVYTPLLKRVIENAILEAKESVDKEVTIEHLFLSILEEGEGVAIRVLLSMNVSIEELYKIIINKKSIINHKKLLIEEIAINLNQKSLNGKLDQIIGRESELERIIEILSCRGKNNPLLIGEAGVGKSAIVEELVNRIVNKNVPDFLIDKIVYSIPISSLVAGTKYRGEFEEKFNNILKEVEENQNIILFIDEIHTLIGAGGAEGAIDASNILKPILARGDIKLIGATTVDEYRKYIEKDKAFARRFQLINIEEPDSNKTLNILLNIKYLYESYHNVLIKDCLLKEVVYLSDKYIFDRKQPDKAIDILDEACAKISLVKDENQLKISKLKQDLNELIIIKKQSIREDNFEEAINIRNKEKKLEEKINKISFSKKNKIIKILTKDIIEEIVFSKSKIPIRNNNILNLEKDLKEKIIGQKKIVEEIVFAIKRKSLNLDFMKKPNSFLLVGPTGVGKTEIVKEISKIAFGSKLIRLDMSEYKESHSISKIIGSPAGYVGYSDNKCVFEEVRNNPYSVILLDEIEKSCPSVIQLFLQVLDEGKIKLADGKEVRFDHCTIFITSNIGFNKGEVGFNRDDNLDIRNKLKELLNIEFVNRIGSILIFNRLSEKDIVKIVENKLNEIISLYSEKGIVVNYDKSIINYLVKDSNYKEFGARQINNLLDKLINNVIVEHLLEGKNVVNVTNKCVEKCK